MTRHGSAGKVVGRAAAAAIVRAWNEAGATVVLANGIFDVLHVGHVRYLAGAAQLGTRLVVAVNGDVTAAAKGPGRPVVGEADRARLVAAVRGVDLVTVFEEPTVAGLLEELRPAVHAKGTDYTVESVPERETASRLGIRTAIVGDPKQHATRSLIDHVRRLHAGGA